MSEKIAQAINSYIQQEQFLLEQLNQLYSQRDEAELGKEGITQLAKWYFGRTGGKIARYGLTQAEKKSIALKEAEINARHQSIVSSVTALLGTVSEFKRGIKQPNSLKLVSQIVTAQSGAKIATRIRCTIKTLSTIISKQLIYNSDIPKAEPTAILVDAGTPFSASLELRKILASITDYTKILDPYIGTKTLDILIAVPNNVSIKFLAEHIGEKEREKDSRLLRLCKDFRTERPLFELRTHHGLHDRFIISQKQGWQIGTSLKDFGNRISTLSPLSEDLKKDIEKKFDQLWSDSDSIL